MIFQRTVVAEISYAPSALYDVFPYRLAAAEGDGAYDASFSGLVYPGDKPYVVPDLRRIVESTCLFAMDILIF